LVPVDKLTVLPDNQLAGVSGKDVIMVWDTQRLNDSGIPVSAPASTPSTSMNDYAGGTRPRQPLVCSFWADISLAALAPLPGNRLATGVDGGVYLWQLPPRSS